MADEVDKEDQTEEPTEKKLRDAAEQGDNPVSREAPLFAALLASLVVCSLMLRENAIKVVGVLSRLIEDPAQLSLRNGADAGLLVHALMQTAADFLVPILVLFIVAGIAVSCAQNMPSVVLSRIAPKLSKLSPTSGLKRIFGRSGLVEFAKGLAKLLIVSAVVSLLLTAEQHTVIDSMFVEPEAIPDRMLGIFIRLLSGVATAFAVLAAIDYVYSRATWKKRMRMSKREIKDEMKQSEGDPLMKAKRRSLALDRSRRRMMADVPRATLIITNPTHYAIALRYVRGEGAAPIVLAKGQDLLALKIREIAAEHGITVIENKPLARSMYDHVQVSEQIPPQFYKAVAEIIHYVQSRNVLRPSSN